MTTRKVRLSVSIVTRILGVTLASLTADAALADIYFPDFSTTSGLTLVGNAAKATDVLRITPAKNNQTGAAWYSTRQPVQSAFTTTFQFQITEPSTGSFNGADGFAFVIQNKGPAVIGDGGGNLGYQNISNSLAVEFDTLKFFNSDPNDNHISIHTRGLLANSADDLYALASTGTGLAVNLSDGLVHEARIAYQPGTMKVFLDGIASPILTASVDLGSLLTLTSGGAYVGFTGGTGAGFENHDVLSWTMSPVPEPSTLLLGGVGLAVMLIRTWYQRSH